MAGYTVTGDQYRDIDRRMIEIKRQLNQEESPLDPKRVLLGLQDLIEGNFDAIPVGPRRLIDTGANPYIQEGMTIETHRKGGAFEFDPAKIVLHLDEAQKTGTVVGNTLWEKWKDLPVLNATVLDHLLANTNLIPEEWKVDEKGQTRYIYFPGTRYRLSVGGLYVRYLYWGDGQWYSGCGWLGVDWDDQYPVALLAS